MDKLFSVPLKGGCITDVFALSSIDDLMTAFAALPQDSFFVFDENSANVFPYLPERSLVLPPGEVEKNWASIDKILSRALSLGMARDSLFVGVGGGVILDMTAFASSLYMRGARCILVPTTLLSAVDATLGGKTGIDYGGAKNIVGTFYPAESILICPETLKTLSDREFHCGLGEVVKHAFLSADTRLYNFLISNKDAILRRDNETVSEMIRLSLEVKIHYITRDPEEKKGIRSCLNLGHTFGHALEAMRGYSVSHGEGVAWGMARAFEAGERTGITPSEYAESSIDLIRAFGFDIDSKIESSEFPAFMAAIAKDKKKKGGEVKFILMEGQGSPVLKALEENTIRAVIL